MIELTRNCACSGRKRLALDEERAISFHIMGNEIYVVTISPSGKINGQYFSSTCPNCGQVTPMMVGPARSKPMHPIRRQE